MKTLEEMVQKLARQGASELAMATGRLPCIKVAGQFQPVDDQARSTEQLTRLLAAAGGERALTALGPKPVTWQARLEGAGPVAITAALRDGVLQVRVVVARAPATPDLASAAKLGAEPEFEANGNVGPAAQHVRVLEGGPIELEPAPVADAGRGLREGSVAGGVRAKARDDQPAFSRSGAPNTLEAPTSLRAPVGPNGPAAPALAPSVVSAGAPLVNGASSNLGSFEDVAALARGSHASDVHVVAERPLLLRLLGELVSRGSPIPGGAVERMADEIVPARLKAQLAHDGSCDFALETRSGRARINVSRQRTGLKISARLIAPGVPTLQSLGLPEAIGRATHHHQGLILVTGPTGHGKTSTLSAIVDIVNRETTHHVITVEDPIEYVHPRKKAMMSQREVGTNTRSFFTALKGSLREDPDVIVVGELRDAETVRMALSASETGHLVIGTMNTPSAAKTIERLIDLFPPADQAQVRMTLAGGLRLIVSQRLLPAANGQGLAAAAELLPGSVSLWSLIRDAKTYQIPSLQQRGKALGIVRLDDSLADLVFQGRVTLEAARHYAEAPDDLEAAVQARRQAASPAAEAPKANDKAGLLGKAGNLFRKGP